jgi:hypothetical protein
LSATVSGIEIDMAKRNVHLQRVAINPEDFQKWMRIADLSHDFSHGRPVRGWRLGCPAEKELGLDFPDGRGTGTTVQEMYCAAPGILNIVVGAGYWADDPDRVDWPKLLAIMEAMQSRGRMISLSVEVDLEYEAADVGGDARVEPRPFQPAGRVTFQPFTTSNVTWTTGNAGTCEWKAGSYELGELGGDSTADGGGQEGGS